MATRIQKVDYVNIRGSYENLSRDSREFKGWVTRIERVFKNKLKDGHAHFNSEIFWYIFPVLFEQIFF